jgi:hypothetical protein
MNIESRHVSAPGRRKRPPAGRSNHRHSSLALAVSQIGLCVAGPSAAAVVRLPNVAEEECPRNGRGYQEQTQIIAAAIGKPTAKAATIVDANATRKSSSGCTLSSSGMWPTSLIGKPKKPSSGKAINGFPARAHSVQKPRAKGCPKMVNKVLIAVLG